MTTSLAARQVARVLPGLLLKWQIYRSVCSRCSYCIFTESRMIAALTNYLNTAFSVCIARLQPPDYMVIDHSEGYIQLSLSH